MFPGKTTLGTLVSISSLTLLPSLAGCAGKSMRSGGEDGNGDRGGDAGESGTSGRAGRGGTGGAGGTGGTSGTSGRGGTSTGGTTSNALVERITQTAVDKIDLLFMVDNSVSMAHKQSLLAEAIPVLVQRLVDPICVDANGNPVGGTTSADCSPNRPEFAPVQDIHIGVITSSLGSHGGEVCVSNPADMPPRTLNDAAQLLPSVRTNLYSYQDQGFLVWDPRSERPLPETHPGLTDREQSVGELVTDVAAHVLATGERGCGYEGTLEAWYRFLVDPEPVTDVTIDPTGQFSVRGPVNPVVLQQRAAFLRPDSLLAIVMLTDENDCSILDENGSQGWLVGRRSPMPRASDACSRPDDPNIFRCCIPCLLIDAGSTPAGCDYSGDVSCNGAGGDYLMPMEDSTNLRCFDQVRRFGLNWLYPLQRYVEALTSPRIVAYDDGTDALNPIFMPGPDGTPARDPSLVFLVGIVGVPWQDLVDESSLSGRGVRYLSAQELASSGRWDVMLGDPDRGIRPLDPFMVETIDARNGTNPITGDQPGANNSINGHDQNIVNLDDLQYACTFPLQPPVPCTQSNQDACDCNASEQAYDRPTCDYPRQGSDGTQIAAKAYPSLRQLQVLKGLGDSGVVASVCPKNVTASGDSPSADPDYGYNPAVGAMIGRFREALGARCLPRPLLVDENGQLPCTMVEATFSGGACSCQSPGRIDLASSGTVREAIENELALTGQCAGETGVSCSDWCLCEVEELSGGALDVCRDDPADPGMFTGFCYVDPDNGLGDPDLVSGCPATQRRIVRFMGEGLPASNAQTYIACTND